MQSKFRFKRVLEKVPEKVGDGEALVQSGSTGFRRRFRRRSGTGGFGAEPGVPEKVPEKEGRGRGGCGAEPGQVQQRSREGSGERFQRRSRRTFRRRVLEKVWEALAQNQVRFNRVPEKVRVEGLGQNLGK